MDISENSALFVYPEVRRSGNAPAGPGGRRAGDARLRDLTDMEV